MEKIVKYTFLDLTKINIGKFQECLEKYIISKNYKVRFWKNYRLIIKISIGEKCIGRAIFFENDYDAHCDDVKIHNDFKRKKICTCMYLIAEYILEKELIPDVSGMTEAGKSFWDFYKSMKRGNKNC